MKFLIVSIFFAFLGCAPFLKTIKSEPLNDPKTEKVVNTAGILVVTLAFTVGAISKIKYICNSSKTNLNNN